MKIEFELWQLITLLLAFFGFVAAAFKVYSAQAQRAMALQFEAMNKRLDSIDATGRAEANNWQRVERELLNLKAELPLHYVRREDYVQAIATIMAKLDAMAMRFENILLKGERRDA